LRHSALSGFRQRVEHLHAQLRQVAAPPVELVDDIIRALDLERHWRDEQAPEGRDQDEADPLELVDLIRLHAADATDLTSFLKTWDALADEEKSGAGMDGDELAREESEDEDRVVIGTMHASKGREYDSVVLYDYSADLSRLDTDQVEEERRVFYVGMTRARDALMLTIDASKPLHAFIRESIEPEKPSECEMLAQRRLQCREDARVAKIERARAENRLAQVHDGRECARLDSERTAAAEKMREYG
jgi:superfamily I DNA/RNA helicase